MGLLLQRVGQMSFPFTTRHLNRFSAGRNSEIGSFLYPLCFNAHDLYDHFTGDTLDTNRWTTTADAGGTAFAQRVADATGTWIRSATAATDNNTTSIYSANHFFGDNDCLMIVKARVDRATDLWMECGFADVISDKTLPVVTDVDTPTTGNGAGDLAVIHLDTDQTLKTTAFVTEGSTASMNPTKTNLGTWIPTAAEPFYLVVGITGNNAYGAVGNQYGVQLQHAEHGGTVASQTEGGTAMMGWFMGGTRVATDTAWDIDLIRVIGGDGL